MSGQGRGSGRAAMGAAAVIAASLALGGVAGAQDNNKKGEVIDLFEGSSGGGGGSGGIIIEDATGDDASATGGRGDAAVVIDPLEEKLWGMIEAQLRRNEACEADRQRLCPEVEFGQGRVIRCLRARQDELSEGCKARMEKGRSNWTGVYSACAADWSAHCRDVEPGEGRVARCLLERGDKLQKGCRTALDELGDNKP